MKLITMVIVAVAGGLVVGTVYNFDASSGQKKFHDLCKNEGGSKFYDQVDRDVGWEVQSEDEAAYKVPFNIGHVNFVRFRDKHGGLFDVHAKAGPNPWAKDYEIAPADTTRLPQYRLTTERGLLPDDARIGRTRYVITDVSRGAVVAMHTYFNYSWTKPDRVVLNAPTSTSCFAGSEVDSFYSAIYEARRN